MRNIKNDTSFLGDKAYNELKRSIVQGELKPGDRLTEIGLTEQLGVSRTPVREALRRLCYEGYIGSSGGYEVKGISQKDVQDILEIRRSLECEAARIAAKRITPEQKEQMQEKYRCNFLDGIEDPEQRLQRFMEMDRDFHNDIYQLTGNPRFMEIANSLQDRLYRLRLASITREEEMRDCMTQHQQIMDAILAGEAERASFYCRIHLEDIEALYARMADDAL